MFIFPFADFKFDLNAHFDIRRFSPIPLTPCLSGTSAYICTTLQSFWHTFHRLCGALISKTDICQVGMYCCSRHPMFPFRHTEEHQHRPTISGPPPPPPLLVEGRPSLDNYLQILQGRPLPHLPRRLPQLEQVAGSVSNFLGALPPY